MYINQTNVNSKTFDQNSRGNNSRKKMILSTGVAERYAISYPVLFCTAVTEL